MKIPRRTRFLVKPERNSCGAKNRNGKTQRGVTLIEALITLFVLSIGLLGMAALQLVGTQENSSAFRHTQATWFANDMADRMRANQVGIAGDEYDSIDTSTLPSSPPACTTITCTPAQIALMDTNQWGLQLQGLPGGIGTVTSDAGTPERFRIQVRWQDDITATLRRVCPSDSSSTSTRQACVEITIQP